jgi:AdoMet-dependent heme synthase
MSTARLRDLARLGRQTLKTFAHRPAPLEVGWDVTYRCNARCAYCTNWTTNYPVMPLAKVAALIERVARMGTFQMSLSGGEPLTRKDIVDIVTMVKSAGMRCSVVSNGSLGREELYRRLMQAGLDSITFSLDGASKEAHERFRHGTSFEKVLSSIRTCVDLKEKDGYPTRVSTNTVLTNANVDEIPKIAALVRAMGVQDFKFQPVWRQHYVPEHLKHRQEDDFNDVYGFTRENEALLERAVRLIREVGASNHPDYTDRIGDFYRGTDRARAVPCYALRAFLFIDADGNVFPCGKVQEKLGNILDDGWEDPIAMLDTPANATLIRSLTAQECGGCAAVCYMERNLLLESMKSPRKLARVVATRVLR